MRKWCFGFVLALALSAPGADLRIDFSNFATNTTPAAFHSALAGGGEKGDWKVVMDESPSAFAPLLSQTNRLPVLTRHAVLAQLSRDATDERFPMLIYDTETFKDFKLRTRFKIVSGVAEQMAGMVFRYQNPSNFYIIRASALGHNIRFYKVVNGLRGNLLGPDTNITTNVWHTLGIQCQGNQITCVLDDQPVMPLLTDNTFASGKIGFWTKSDSVSYFGDTAITYKPHIAPAQALVGDVMKKYPKLVDVKIYVSAEDARNTRLVGSREPADAGTAGATAERDVIERGSIYFGKDKGTVYVTMPLRDRNGDGIAAACVVMKSFKGQTEKNAVERARPIVQEIQARVQSLQDLVD